VTHHANAQLTPVNVQCLMVFMLFVSIFIFAGVFLSIFLFFYLFLLLSFSRGFFLIKDEQTKKTYIASQNYCARPSRTI